MDGHLLEHGSLLDALRYLICIIMNINENLKNEVKCKKKTIKITIDTF